MSRRRIGEGTIYRRKDGRYEGAAYFRTTSGLRKRAHVYGKTWEEAHEKLIEAKMQAQRGIPMPDHGWKLAEYLNYWLEDIVRANRRPTTYAQCEMIVRLYLKPGLGHLSLKRLSVPAVQAYLNQKLREGHSVPKVQVIRKVLSSALTCAMREEYVSRNVARLVVLPKHEPNEAVPWTLDEARRFLDVSRGQTFYAAFVLLLLFGLRRGEVLGLRWSDVDFGHDRIHIRQQLQRVGRELELGPLKTKAGRRELPMLGLVRRALTDHQRRQVGAYEQSGIAHDAQAIIFATRDNKPLEPSILVRSFQRLCIREDIRLIRVHDIRHTTATLLKGLGVPVRDAQLILGHARISTTQEIYEHDTAEERRQSLELVETALTKQRGLPWKRMGRPPVSSSSRQFSRQNVFVDVLYTIFNFGAGSETLTRDLILGKSINASIADRSTEVKVIMMRRTRQWLLAVAAVKSSRQTTESIHASHALAGRSAEYGRRRVAASASSLHKASANSNAIPNTWTTRPCGQG